MNKLLEAKTCGGALAALALGLLSAMAQPTGQWDFDAGNLTGTVGATLQYLDGANGATQQGTQFGSTTTLGLPDIGGAPAQVMKFPGGATGTGYVMPTPASPNGGGSLVNNWTIVLDLLFPAGSDSKPRALIETDLGLIDADAEFFVNADNGIGNKGQSFGKILPNTWYRVGFVVDGEGGFVRLYIDGEEVGVRKIANLLDGRFAFTPGSTAQLFADDTGETASGYVNAIQLRNVALSKGQMRALGGPSAAGIPQTVPPVPSGVEQWIPAGDFASRTTSVGAMLSPGDTTIQDSSISLKLNGQAQANPSITHDAGLITIRSAAQNLTPGTDYTIELAFTDSLAGQKTLTHKFAAALFFEDFENVALGPKVDEPGFPDDADNQKVWTNKPPQGWSVDNSQFPATVISADNPDGDGDGFADNDGRTEWAGWAFAKKEFWLTADDQRRSEFSLASGNLAIADPDEWDDQGHLPGLFNSFLKTPEIPIEGVSPNTAFLRFASSWRPEANDDGPPNFPEGKINNQTAIISASYDGGAPAQVLKWDSKGDSPTFHPDAPNETILVQLNNPAGTKKLVLTFALVEAANDWWWAVDNIVVNTGASPPIISKQPDSIIASATSSVTFSVAASGTEPFTYQWQWNGNNIAGATEATYTLNNVQKTGEGEYRAIVSNAGGSATSSVAKLVVFEGPITTDLVAHLKFDNDLADSSGRNNNGAAVGAPTFTAGKIGAQGLHIPSGSDYVSLGAPADLNFGASTDFSISFWVKVAAWVDDPSFLANKDWDSGGNQGYVLATDSDGRIQWNLAGPPGARKDYDGPGGTFSDNLWHHVAVTFKRDGAAATYIDGAVRNSTSLTVNQNNVDTPENFATNIGQDGAGDYGPHFTDADFDDLGIWRRALTVQEIAAIYNAGLKGDDLTKATATAPPTPPSITTQPASRTLFVGDSITFNVTATGSQPLIYQWKLNGTEITGATSASLTIPNLTKANAGPYTVIVSNAGGLATSSVATLTVNDIPVPANVTDGLVAHLKFDGDYQDSSGNNANGTAVGSPSIGQGKIGSGALVYATKKDGSSFNYVTLGNPAPLNFGNNKDFTVSFWGKLDTWEGDPAFIANKDWGSGGNIGWVAATAGDGRIQWNFREDGGAARKDYDGPAGLFSDKNWHHIVISFTRGGTGRTYVDGQLVSSVDISPNTGALESGLAVNIGQDGKGTYTDGNSVSIENGMIDDLAIWTRTLAPSEITQIHSQGQSGQSFDTGAPQGIRFSSITASGGAVTIAWTGGTGPFLVQFASALGSAWQDLVTTTERTATVPLVGNVGFLRVADGATKTVKLFKATLTPQQEVQTPAVQSSASGVGFLSLDGDKATYYVSFAGLGSNAAAAHVHGRAPAGQNASVYFHLLPSPNFPDGTRAGILSGSTTLTAEQKAAIEAGETYFNIHTITYGSGEIRGQLLP